ncbi:MAG TPA: prolyl oligopeptidase family serine peptidase [Xanthobacteraceae bacterium]|jgi:prolyl oligopeptidase
MPAPDPRPTLEAPDDDPHLWLEEIENARVLDWVEAQNAATLEGFHNDSVATDHKVLKAIFDRPDNIPFPNRRAGKLFNPWRDDANPRGVWRTTTLESFRKDAPDWDVLIDVDALAAKEGEDWVWRGGDTLPPAHHRAVVRLSRGGADAVVLREFDLTTREFVLDGFNLPESKSATVWLNRDTLLLASPSGSGMATRSGQARTIRLWRRGSDPLSAPVIFETNEESAGVWAFVERDGPAERIWFVERRGIIDANIWIGDRNGPTTRVEVPSDCWAQVRRGWLAVKLRTPWNIGGETYGADTVIGTSFQAFLAGERHFMRLFEPGDRRALQHFFWCGGRLVLSILDDLRPVFEVFTPSEGEWSQEAVAGLPDLGAVHVWPFDVYPEESNGDLLAAAQDPLTPPSLYLVKPGAVPELLKHAPEAFDVTGLVMTRHEAVSSDGTRVPYVQVGPANEIGHAPVHLYGYGGFGISMVPFYHPAIGKLWLERGGTSVIAHIRGGREFGKAWYEAARREGRRLAHDDFAAVAADLVHRGVTRPDRIAAEGGSNGGLLIANMLTRYPERFGALFCTMPVIDMRRYHKLLIGPAITDEFGDPDKPEDWAFLAGISAYHVAAPGKIYPPILIATSRRDDRAHPGHARKMAAKLQAMGYDASFYELATGGHSYGKNHDDMAAFVSLGYAFLRRAIGWSPD